MAQLGVQALSHLHYRCSILGGGALPLLSFESIVIMVTASVDPDQCAVGSDGQLKDPTDIEWFNDADDSAPVAGPSSKDSDLR